MCRRQVGLWTFAQMTNGHQTETNGSSTPIRRPQVPRQFDVLKEHRSHCPYVEKSTYLPSLPTFLSRQNSYLNEENNNAPLNNVNQTTPFVEGWKALLTVLSRSRWRKASVAYNNLIHPGSHPPEEDEFDEIAEMVNLVTTKHNGVSEIDCIRRYR